MKTSISVILPARDEAATIGPLVKRIRELLPDAEVIVVNDGSIDDTAAVAQRAGARILNHLYPTGNGAAVKNGARIAKGETLVFMDADGQHEPGDIPRLLDRLSEGYEMVIGARQAGSHGSPGRLLANALYNRLAGYISGQRVEDLTSGFRAANAKTFRGFLSLLPNGFSYPTTSTMAFLRAGHAIAYEPIHTAKRIGNSHLKPWKDGVRFLLIIFKIGTLYSPLKLFAPLALLFFLTGAGWYAYTFVTIGRFTNMSALLLSAAFIVFTMGLISEQITMLMYRDTENP